MAVTDCFCGCGQQVRKPLVVVNLLGVELYLELAKTLELKKDLEKAGISTESFEPLLEDGRTYYGQLQAVVHDEEPVAYLDNRNTKRWIKFAKKSRKKIDRKITREYRAAGGPG